MEANSLLGLQNIFRKKILLTDTPEQGNPNRTLQEECLKDIPKTIKAYKKVIPEYIHCHNTERLHLELNLKTPMQVVTSY